MNFIIAGFVIVHIVFVFTLTQTLYNRNKILTATLISLFFPFLISIFLGTKTQFAILNASMISFYYCLLLNTIKSFYRKVNDYLISKEKIAKLHKGKDYTFVNQTEEGTWWNTNVSTKPSWLDSIITFCLLVLPIIFFSFFNFLFSLISNSNNFQGIQ
jgi:uncharacterized membrane protein